jgi:hypothetical protein
VASGLTGSNGQAYAVQFNVSCCFSFLLLCIDVLELIIVGISKLIDLD